MASDAPDLGTATGVNTRQSQSQRRPGNELDNRTIEMQNEGEMASVDVSAGTSQPTTSGASHRQRTRWTKEQNEYLVKCYFTATKLETSNEPYSEQLHVMFIAKYPELGHKSIQNILDQRRSIFARNSVLGEVRDQIRREVGIELGLLEPIENTATNNNEPPHEVSVHETVTEAMFRENCIKYGGIEPACRPGIPKLKYKWNTNEILNEIDLIIKASLSVSSSLCQVHELVYIGAITAVMAHNQNPIPPNNNTRKERPKIPAWEKRLTDKIKLIRRELGRVTAARQSNSSEKVRKMAMRIFQKYRNNRNNTESEIKDLLKQKLAAFSKRLRRYQESNLRRIQNAQFQRSEKTFYRSLSNTTGDSTGERVPNKSEVIRFWENIWNDTTVHKAGAAWIREEKTLRRNTLFMDDHIISVMEVSEAVKKTNNWKAPGPDRIQNFWYKRFKSTHVSIASCFNNILHHPDSMPVFMTKGVTYLLPKTTLSTDPSKYRPITCLPTIYKMFTSVITGKIYSFVERNSILAIEQKGCRKGHQGCKEQLIIDQVVTGNVRRRKQDLWTAYVDYQKAFDSVPHSWLLEILQIYKIDPIIQSCLSVVMKNWSTSLKLLNQDMGIINIRRGIFQGDSLSPLWFCLALNPLSTMLNKIKDGYALPTDNRKLNHLLYMDDLKLFANTREGLDRLLRATKTFSTDIDMKFGLDKCRINAIRKGMRHLEDIEDQMGQFTQNEILLMQENEVYKYLGYSQALGIDQKEAKDTLKVKYKVRLNNILKSKLCGKFMIKAVNTYAIPVLTYSFGIIKWTQTELESLDRLGRTTFTKYRMHHPKSAVERVYLPRRKGGRGVTNITNLHMNQVNNLYEYFKAKSEESPFHASICTSDGGFTPLNLSQAGSDRASVTDDQWLVAWRQKEIHGRFPAILNQPGISYPDTMSWLVKCNVFAETEGFMFAIQDGVIATRNYRRYILKEELEDKCRMCNTSSETIEHIMSGCTVLAPIEYTYRHNNVAKIIHQELAIMCKFLEVRTPYYRYEPASVLENDAFKLYWDRTIITDRTIPHNVPDIVLQSKIDKCTCIIDIAVPQGNNIDKRHVEKITKYMPLAVEVKELWGQEKVVIVPIVIGTMGEIPIKLAASLKTLKLKKNLYMQLQKSVLLDTCNIVRKVIGNIP